MTEIKQREILFMWLLRKTRYKMELRAFPSKRRIFARSIDKIEQFIKANETDNLYFGVYTREGGGKKRNIREVICFFADLDFKTYQGGEEEAWQRLNAFPIKPSAVIHSGNGLHAYWFLTSPIDPSEKVERILRGIARKLKSDPAVCELARILRIPGTTNYKDGAKKPVRIVEWNDIEYGFEIFEPYAHNEKNGETRMEIQHDLNDLIKKITTECSFFNYAFKHSEDLSEPLWFAMVSNLARYHTKPVDLVHAFSRNYPGYSPQETDQKIRRALNDTGPHRCETIKGSFDCGRNCCVTAPVVLLNRDKQQKAAIPSNGETALSLIKSADDLLATSRDTEWLVYGMFPRKALSIIGGAQKEGKTWFALEIGTAFSCGRDVFGIYPSQEGKVLFIEGDVPDELIKWRLQNCGYRFRSDNFLSLNKFDLLNKGQHMDLSTPEGTGLFEILVSTIKPDLVFIDSLSAFHTIDEKDAAAVKPIIHFLTHMAGKYDAHISLVHHSRKRKKMEEKLDISMDDLIGSNVPLRFASIVYGVQKRKDISTGQPQYTLTTLGSWFRPIDPVILKIRDDDSEEEKLTLDWSTAEFLPKNKIEHAMFAIEKLLRESGTTKRAEIIDSLPLINSRTVDRALARLFERDRILRHGSGNSPQTYYEIPLREGKKCRSTTKSHTGSHSTTSTRNSTDVEVLGKDFDNQPVMSKTMSKSKNTQPQGFEPYFDINPSLRATQGGDNGDRGDVGILYNLDTGIKATVLTFSDEYCAEGPGECGQRHSMVSHSRELGLCPWCEGKNQWCWTVSKPSEGIQ